VSSCCCDYPPPVCGWSWVGKHRSGTHCSRDISFNGRIIQVRIIQEMHRPRTVAWGHIVIASNIRFPLSGCCCCVLFAFRSWISINNIYVLDQAYPNIKFRQYRKQCRLTITDDAVLPFYTLLFWLNAFLTFFTAHLCTFGDLDKIVISGAGQKWGDCCSRKECSSRVDFRVCSIKPKDPLAQL
jgi:hypothetical protein